MRLLKALAIAAPFAVFVAGATPASATLLQNGGFETGDLSGWTLVDPSSFTGVSGAFPPDFPHSGLYYAYLGALTPDGTLSQPIADTAGETLQLSYWLANDAAGTNDFSVEWNGTLIAGSKLVNADPFGYTNFSFAVVATGADTLTFFESNVSGFFNLDDVSLNVPEPLTLSLFGAGLAGAVAMRRRKKK